VAAGRTDIPLPGNGAGPDGRLWRGLAEVVESRPVPPPSGPGPGPRAGEAAPGACGSSPYHLLVLRAPEVAGRARPGQFAHVACPAAPPGPCAGGVPSAGALGPRGDRKVADTPQPRQALPRPESPGIPFLRRPISFHDADPEGGTVTLLFEVVGPGTARLSRVRPGEAVDLIGPLGEGVFPLDPAGPVVAVGGGAGAAPLFFLARRLLRAAGPAGPAAGPMHLLIGLPDGGHLGLVERFRELGPGVEVAAACEEEGVPGTTTGLVTDLLARVIERRGRRRPVVYACGPWAMLLAVRRLAREAGLEAWISTGEHMACGVGACRGCSVPAAGRPGSYRRSCRDGPVFEAGDLDWERIAAIYLERGDR